MKIVKTIVSILIILAAAGLSVIALSGFFENSPPEANEEPLARVVIIGNISRNTSAINQWLKGGQFDFFTDKYLAQNYFVLGHYDNSMPSDREKEVLQKAGLSALTLPFLEDEDVEYLLGDGQIKDEPFLKEKLSVIDLAGWVEKVVVLNLSSAIEPEQLREILSDANDASVIIVKFQQNLIEWDNAEFQSMAETAIDGGADIVIGSHGNTLSPVQIYKKGVIIPSLSSFLGGRNDAAAFVAINFYPAGVVVKAEALTLKNGSPKFLSKPWHYFEAQKQLNQIVSPDFSRNWLNGIYISPTLLNEEEEAHAAAAWEGHAAASGYGVAAGHPLAVEAGIRILEAGGNAIDAAVAVAYALAVVEPDGSGLGGGGIMLIHLAEENRQVVIDYRETAPFTMDRDDIKKIMNWPSTGIPGFVRGLEKAIGLYGTISYADAINPALGLARDGFAMTQGLNSRVRNNTGKLARSSDALRDFFRNGWPARVGEKITQPALAKTLQSIMEEGSSVFYEGYISDSIIKVLEKQGMYISKQDLFNYQPAIREPIKGEYRDLSIVTVPPPAGGFNVLQQLLILSHFDLSSYAEPTPEVYKLMEQAIKATYSDRRNYIGDPNFVYVPIAELLSRKYVAEKIEQINSGNVPLEMFSDPYRPSDNTTHFVVADSQGNWVSVTNTLSYLFGYGLQAEGFFLNTQLNNFSSNPVSPNYFQPGKRPFSHISPILVFKDGYPVMALGSPGGRRIPAFLTQVLVLFADFGLNIEDAVDYPRFWSEGKKIWFEVKMPKGVTSYFQQEGYEVVRLNPSSYFGRIAAIYYDADTGEIRGTGDPLRGEGVFRHQ
ncbi:MAG: gamma-glutamyltransferase [Dethiobacter sp.]|jgi:gamma-glutamyltranspeptidase/glutathione hydrolase|nr:gamma-glutamyltransferase [Dethiobacter sp.]